MGSQAEEEARVESRGERASDPLLPTFSLAKDTSHREFTSSQSQTLSKKRCNYEGLLWASLGSRMKQDLFGQFVSIKTPSHLTGPELTPALKNLAWLCRLLFINSLSNWANHCSFPSFFSCIREKMPIASSIIGNLFSTLRNSLYTC